MHNAFPPIPEVKALRLDRQTTLIELGFLASPQLETLRAAAVSLHTHR